MPQPDDARPASDARPGGEGPPAVATREVSLDEAVSMAILFLKNQALDDAGRLLGAVLEAAPAHPVALHYAGVLAHQQGRRDEAIALIERSLEADPGQADWHNNLGIVLKAAGRHDEAMAAYRRALALDAGHARARNNLGVLERLQGRSSDAEASYREAIRLDPGYAEAYHNLGTVLASQRRAPEAVQAFSRALVLSPAAPETRRLLALAYCALGERDKAVRIYDDWLLEEPGHPVARHMRAACSGEQVPERASDAYVERVFDDFAETFDAKLARLGYRAPQIVAAMLADAGATPTGELEVLDAGCGTGLCGPLLRPYARRLVGVDLSAQMLGGAARRGVYDDLCRAELTGYLAARPAGFDAVVSADTLVYFGALGGVLAAAASALRPGGWLIFTVEAAADQAAPLGYQLLCHGRYGHSRRYLEDQLRRAGFRFDIVEAELRMEGGLPVAGFAVRAAAPLAGRGPRDGADDA